MEHVTAGKKGDLTVGMKVVQAARTGLGVRLDTRRSLLLIWLTHLAPLHLGPGHKNAVDLKNSWLG